MAAYVFTDAQKTDLRRFMGYPPKGTDYNTIMYGAIFNSGGEVEYRLDKLTIEEGAIAKSHLARLKDLEEAVYAAADNLDTDQIAVISRNRSEVPDRLALFDTMRRRLCEFLGLPPGPYLRGGGRWTRLVV